MAERQPGWLQRMIVSKVVTTEGGVTAIVGPTGPRGAQGPTGAQGEPGPIGSQGPAGATGPRGPAGAGGASAFELARAKGFSGSEDEWLDELQGPRGIPGENGVDGADGAMGPRGIQGEQGPAGSKGDRGDPGPQGVQGVAGADGNPGPKGDQGDRGEQGSRGAAGADGGTGATGPQGAKGDKGDTGATGPQGLQGVQGAKGDTGATGPAGTNGSNGSAGATGPAGLGFGSATRSHPTTRTIGTTAAAAFQVSDTKPAFVAYTIQCIGLAGAECRVDLFIGPTAADAAGAAGEWISSVGIYGLAGRDIGILFAFVPVGWFVLLKSVGTVVLANRTILRATETVPT